MTPALIQTPYPAPNRPRDFDPVVAGYVDADITDRLPGTASGEHVDGYVAWLLGWPEPKSEFDRTRRVS